MVRQAKKVHRGPEFLGNVRRSGLCLMERILRTTRRATRRIVRGLLTNWMMETAHDAARLGQPAPPRVNADNQIALRKQEAPVRFKLLMGLASVVLSVAMVEGSVRWLYKTPYQWERRLMFFSEGRNFRNTDWGGFVYQPHARIHSRTYYITSLEPLEVQPEYDYEFTTNGNGLVQLKELDPSKTAIVFLGDSFTDGQGARPWFYRLEEEWPEGSRYQIVNGGIVGTGIEAWGRLYKAMSTQFRITKAVVIFISEDWTRVVWQFSRNRLQCLHTGAMCEGPEDFYGLSEDPIEAKAQIDHIARYRVDYFSRLREGTNAISRSATYTNLVLPTFDRLMRFRYTGSFETRDSKQFETSTKVAAGLVADLGRENVLFIYLPQKNELDTGPRSFGRQAHDFIVQSGFAFVDGRAKCGLSIRDYYERDGHPNEHGYAKIASCVQDAVATAFRP